MRGSHPFVLPCTVGAPASQAAFRSNSARAAPIPRSSNVGVPAFPCNFVSRTYPVPGIRESGNPGIRSARNPRVLALALATQRYECLHCEMA